MSQRESGAQPKLAAPVEAGMGARYVVYGEIASGGMASVQYGRLLGPRGFSRAVAIKRLHAQFAQEPEFVSMFVDEARLSARLVHANIVHTLDVIETPGEVALVMEYVQGETLWTLLRLAQARGTTTPVRVGCAVLASVLHGLDAAHEARTDSGEPLNLVHRDVSPQNILIGADGIPRLLDFGIAKALGRLRSTPMGEIKGKLGYIAREQLHSEPVDRRADVYGASAVLWEVLTGKPLFSGETESELVHGVLYGAIHPPSRERAEISQALDAIVLRGLERDATLRWATARDMALALERTVGLATQSEVAAWLQELASVTLERRMRKLTEMQRSSRPSGVPPLNAIPSGTRRIGPPVDSRVAEAEDALTRDIELLARRPQVGRNVFLALLAVAALGTAVWADDLRALVHPSRADSQPMAAEAPSAATSASATPPIASSVEPEQPPPALAASTNDSFVPTPARREQHGSSSAPVSRARAAAIEGAGGSTAKSAAKRNCARFYDVDHQGIRRPKPECL